MQLQQQKKHKVTLAAPQQNYRGGSFYISQILAPN